jgi:hypothetical protein
MVSAGANGSPIDTQVLGTNAPSTSRNQVVVSTGIRHRFQSVPASRRKSTVRGAFLFVRAQRLS